MDRDQAARFLRRHGWLSKLPEVVQADWLAGARHLHVSKGEQVFDVEDDPRFMIGIASGTIGAYLSYHHEETRLMMLYCAGNWAGDAAVISGNPHRGAAVARTDCTLLVVPASHVDAVAERHPGIWRQISLNVLFQFDSFLTLTEAALSRDPVSRIITLILGLRKLNPRDTGFELSNDEIGQMVGLTRNTVNKCLRELEGEGVIERGYGRFTVVRFDQLEGLRRTRT